MSDQGQRTEKATPQRLKKAREQGQFPAAKEFVAAVQFLGVLVIFSTWGQSWFSDTQVELRRSLARAFSPGEFNISTMVALFRGIVWTSLTPILAAGGLLIGITLAAQLLSTNMGVSLNRLAPDLKRFSPMARLKEIPRQNIPAVLQCLVLLAVTAIVIYYIALENYEAFLRLPLAGVGAGWGLVADSISQLLWKMAGVLVVVGVAEMLRQRWRYSKDLSMTKQEIRDEHKEQDGDPHTKSRIRRLQREMSRRRMMKDVPTATAVIVNPTHYSVAIKYDLDKMASPTVVAKGKNLIAARIRQLAVENGVPIVENPPLARALYSSVDIGREIPPDFYKAVAEVLAYIYRLTGSRTARNGR